MLSFPNLLSHVALAVAYASATSASPVLPDTVVKYSTHATREVGEGVRVESFYPPGIYKVCTDSLVAVMY